MDVSEFYPSSDVFRTFDCRIGISAESDALEPRGQVYI